jgi:GT2 family glycosyltransferase
LIAFTDADCTVDSDWLRSIEDAMEDPSLGMLVGHFRYPRRASVALRLLGIYENAKTEYVLNRCPSSQHFAYANNMAIRASLFESLGGFKEWERASDTEFVHRVASYRPDLRLAYDRSMRITHLEFVSARARARRLLLYAQTNSKIDTFEELGPSRRIAALTGLLRGPRRRRGVSD